MLLIIFCLHSVSGPGRWFYSVPIVRHFFSVIQYAETYLIVRFFLLPISNLWTRKNDFGICVKIWPKMDDKSSFTKKHKISFVGQLLSLSTQQNTIVLYCSGFGKKANFDFNFRGPDFSIFSLGKIGKWKLK